MCPNLCGMFECFFFLYAFFLYRAMFFFYAKIEMSVDVMVWPSGIKRYLLNMFIKYDSW